MDYIVHNDISVYDTQPFEDSIRSWMLGKTDYRKRVVLGTTNINTGEFVTFDQDNTSYNDMATVSKASCSVPTFYPPVEYEGKLLMDGVVAYDINVSSAIDQCHAMGATNEEITIDMAYWLLRPQPGGDTKTTIPNYLNARKTKFYYTGMNSVDLEVRASSGVNFRYYFQEPVSDLTLDMLNWDGDFTWPL